MHIRRCRDGSHRIRLYHAHEDQIQTIRLALDAARLEAPSEFDIVLLELICLAYLTAAGSAREPYPARARTAPENDQ
jgi:hypothetical protein